MCIIDCLSTIVFILPLHLDYTKVIILILWWRNFQLEYWRTFQLVSTISSPESGICYIFEGFMDFLSFRRAFPSLEEGDYIVLNSVSNLQKAFSFLARYDGICCCLDNDTAGKNAVQALKEKYGIRICDLSHEYSGYKDLNEYLCGKNNRLHI